METAYFPKAVRWKVFGTAGKKSRNTCWITSHASKWSQLDYLVRVYYSTVLFTSWVGGWISKCLLGLQQTCILLSYLDVVPWLMPNSEGLLIERSAFSDGEETFWVFCNPSRCSLPRESQEFHLVHWEHYISVPRKMTESTATFQKMKDSSGNIHLWDCLWQIALVFLLPVCLDLSRKGWVV